LDQCGQTQEEIHHRCAIIPYDTSFSGINRQAIAQQCSLMPAVNTPVSPGGQMMIPSDFVDENFSEWKLSGA
jgi:hypothetical protein